VKTTVTAHRPLLHETIVSNQEIGEVVAVVDRLLVAAMVAAMVVRMADHMEGLRLAQTGGAISCLSLSRFVPSMVRLCTRHTSSLTC